MLTTHPSIIAIIKITFFSYLASSSHAQYSNPLTFTGAFNLTYGLLSSTVDYLASRTGMAETCPMVDEIMLTLQSSLPKHIKAQDEAVRLTDAPYCNSLILNAVAGWEFQKRSGVSEPLVLAFTGSTGVGKTETAYRLAESVLTRHSRVGSSRRFLPQGLLVLRGEDYSITSEYAKIGVGEVHRHIRQQLFEQLRRCNGENTIVIFDEIQKVIPGALDALQSSLGERGFVTSGETGDKSDKTYSTANCIFIFISDIGSDRIVKLLLAYDEKSLIPKAVLRAEIKASLDEQWERLQFGKLIKEVIPFQPLERRDIVDVLRLKLLHMSADHRHIYWIDLAVDDAVLDELTGPQYISYANHTTTIRPRGSTTQPAAAEATAAGESAAVVDSSKVAAAPVFRSKVLATWGARALENAGPLQDLRSLIFRYMQPWRATQVLHVGFMDGSESKWRGGAGTVEAGAQLFLQWCLVHRDMYGGDGGGATVNADMTFSDQCETMWFGPLRKL